ncbi:MAG: DNA polymerase III subunit gamma/tau [Candidatus Omnitrophica bacterium]|nr:DNA polymerase III subunit gamma/tau [Candidatus Omnitrophota bacterium]MCB9747958.1 DNA polymerase III subunit gamma/tau [Candidatus Omnitrophota bacterium]
MSYLVLARKHRPQTFADVIGQEHITQLLKKAIENNKIAHAYLFCGPRGIGKTSCARILAMCLNCENGPKTNPDTKSFICQEIAKGTSFDVLEIDGASNRGIDEIRTLRENAKFAPSYGRFKIYIVDEVHMLTTEAFNALLKTLEEPPEHVKFIFATTDPNKVPATILSRCQRFDFKRISINTIVEHLTEISRRENFEIDQEALFAISKAAQGSFRDALSILDQLSALSDRKIAAEDVFSMLGLVETQLLFNLVDAIGEKNTVKSFEVFDEIVDKGKDVKQLMKDITEHFRHLMIIKVGGKALGKLVDYPVAIKELLLAQCEKFSLKEILLAIDVLIETQDTAKIMESVRMPLEIAFARLTYAPGQNPAVTSSQPTPKPAVVEPSSTTASKSFTPVNVLKNNKGEVDFSGGKKTESKLTETVAPSIKQKPIEEEPEAMKAVETVAIENEPLADLTVERIKRMWDALTQATSKRKMSVATFLQEGTPVSFHNNHLIVGFTKEFQFHKESLESQDNYRLVQEVFSEKLQANIIVKYETVEVSVPKQEDDDVQDALATFQGKVISRWHNE